MIAVQWVLVGFLVLAVVFLIVAFVRKVRANGLHTRRSSSQFGQIMGAPPQMPEPDWSTDMGGDDTAGGSAR